MKTQVPSFILKTFNVLENNLYEDIITWSEDGNSFIVKNISQFSSIVLPIHFKHQNFSSFIRQLNMYDFHKIRGGVIHEFQHESFQRGRKDLLSNIKRKAIQITKSDATDQLQQLATQCDYLHNICSSLLESNSKVIKDNKKLQRVLFNQLTDFEVPLPQKQLCLTDQPNK